MHSRDDIDVFEVSGGVEIHLRDDYPKSADPKKPRPREVTVVELDYGAARALVALLGRVVK